MNALLIAAAHIKGPHIDWAALAPLHRAGRRRARGAARRPGWQLDGRAHGSCPALSLLTLAGAIGTEIWRFQHHADTIVAGALRIDDLGLIIDIVCAVAAVAAVLLSLRAVAPREAGHGEFHGLLLFSVMGMAVLASAEDLITLFLGLELLSIPLYVLCAAEYRREGSLESGPQVPDHRLRRIGDARLRPGDDLRRHRSDRLRRDRAGACRAPRATTSSATRCC